MDPETGKRYLKEGNTLSMHITVFNGYPAYQVLIQWGDGEKTEQDNLEKNEFTFTHRYDSQGAMEIEIKVIDIHGRQFNTTIPIQVK